MSTKWTPDQYNAIFARGGTLLVSAAAGSGKTAVLVQRVMERIMDETNPVDADRLLVVTFTKAAAAEMSGRIATEIAKRLEADPYNVRLQRQQILLTRAHISTIDGFCSGLVKENFYKLGISPDFRILDDSEMAVLRAQAAEVALDEFYARKDPLFAEFVEAFASGRDDSRMVETVNRLYDFVRSHPFPHRWLTEKAGLYRANCPAGSTKWGKTVFSFATDAADYCVAVARDSLVRMEEDETVCKAYSEAFQSDLAGLLALKAAIEGESWDKTSFQASNFTWQKLRPLRGYADDPLKNRLSSARKGVRATVGRIAEVFSSDEEQCGKDIRALAPIVEKLFEVTERFSGQLDQLKKERRAADFGDLEHWALRLLVRETGEGFERTEDAVEISSGFEEIMVDEYQDTNETQDMIFRALSRDETNLFLVGDVKQSIYRFRQAMPQLFLKRRMEFPVYDRSQNRYPACITLDRNFRSRPGVTGIINFIFRQLMSRQTGELDYTGSEELVPAAEYPPCEEPAARLDILDLSASDGETDLVRVESTHLAELIYRMTDGTYTVADHGKQRPAVYRDFCILLRSANRYAHEYARELTALGIPAWADTVGGFFASSEIGVALSLLRVIDNPMQDIPLLAVMMSPIYGFTPDEMSEIRIHSRTGRLYPAVVTAAGDGNQRAADFLQELEKYRTLAAAIPSDRLIRAVYERTGYPDMVQAMPNGELRLANLRLLLRYAKKYEESGYNGISGFLRFIERLQKSNADLSSASTISESANVVRIMSIHHSKGLEFPVCILAGCSRSFHREHEDVMIHPELGLGVRRKDPETGCRYSTLPREAVALELGRDEMSEELRVLYVAMTRAREKLILLTTLKDAPKTLGRLSTRFAREERIPPYVVRSVSSISDWLLLCALRHPDGAGLRQKAGLPEKISVPSRARWDIRLIAPEDGEEQKAERGETVPAKPDQSLMKKIEAALDYRYPYAGLSGICAKVAASELAAREFSERYAASSRPPFLSESGLTPSERGTAFHAFLQFADFKHYLENPEEELERLTQQKFLTQQQARSVDLKQVDTFLLSPVAKRMLASTDAKREYRFTVEIPAGRVNPEIPAELSDEPVVLQGAVDCVFEEDGELVIIDYKTDRMWNPEELKRRYREQLELYRFSVEKYTGKKVKECLLYSFYLGREISVNEK